MKTRLKNEKIIPRKVYSVYNFILEYFGLNQKFNDEEKRQKFHNLIIFFLTYDGEWMLAENFFKDIRFFTVL